MKIKHHQTEGWNSFYFILKVSPILTIGIQQLRSLHNIGTLLLFSVIKQTWILICELKRNRVSFDKNHNSLKDILGACLWFLSSFLSILSAAYIVNFPNQISAGKIMPWLNCCSCVYYPFSGCNS